MAKIIPTIKTISRRAQSLGSMLFSIHKAGGAIFGFSIPRLKEMSAFELIEILGQNNIHFYYKGNDLNG